VVGDPVTPVTQARVAPSRADVVGPRHARTDDGVLADGDAREDDGAGADEGAAL
jgi:hypothetical protein